jgi:hypothetical protein
MGRYYFGDIEGKFWFGIQDSNDADFFGVEGYPIIHESESDIESGSEKSSSDSDSDSEPEYNEIAYDFEKEHIDLVKEGIEKCIIQIKEYKTKLDTFFNIHNSYTHDQLVQELNIDKDKIHDILEWYARLILGEKILNCLLEKEQCHFGCEL